MNRRQQHGLTPEPYTAQQDARRQANSTFLILPVKPGDSLRKNLLKRQTKKEPALPVISRVTPLTHLFSAIYRCHL